ncbi:hypothetical protein QJS66_14530 [Kocuria rhizophila]|nr:hypothetical protein QJS66_14530 [Kocuria rhizophila]
MVGPAGAVSSRPSPCPGVDRDGRGRGRLRQLAIYTYLTQVGQ